MGAHVAGRRWSKATAAALAALVGASSLVLIQPAVANSAADLVEACDPVTAVPELGSRACRSLQAGTYVPAQGCRRVDGLADSACSTIDGRRVSEAAMAEFEASWLARALALQRQLDLDVPLAQALLPHTHNSANSSAYAPSITTLDANQVLTITDQLRLGMRAIEIDVHWAPHPQGDPSQGMRAVVQCHGEPVLTPAGTIHAGCSVDMLLVDLLAELRVWLNNNPDEVVLLYLENVLDDDTAAHDAAVAAIDAKLGTLVARPAPGAGCQALPVTVTKRQILGTGHQVLITGNCGPGGWNDRVFDRYPSWNERGGSTFDCTSERSAITNFDGILVRRYEDSTWLSGMAGAGSHLDASTISAMVQCGVNLVGFDQLTPDDDRLPGLVWSWRTNEPNPDTTGACAAQGSDGLFAASDCATAHRVACRTTTGWTLSTTSVAWSAAAAACAASSHFDVPVNGWDNAQLRLVAGTETVWLAYHQNAAGTWVTAT